MDPIPGAITVNIGNMLMRLSDNLLKSTYHRVRAPLPDETLVRLFLLIFRVKVYGNVHLYTSIYICRRWHVCPSGSPLTTPSKLPMHM